MMSSSSLPAEIEAEVANDAAGCWETFSIAKELVENEEYEEAAELLSGILEVLVPEYGQFGRDLGPVYVLYGRALMQIAIAKQEDNLLNASTIPENVMEASVMPSKKLKLIEVADDDDNNAVSDGDNDEEEDQQDNGDDNEEEEEQDDFELAWEILDIARLIFSDGSDDASKLRLSEVYCDLGDLAMETEAFGVAAEDFWKAVELKKQLGESQERALASAYYKMAMSLEFDNRAPEAIEPLMEAIGLLKSRLQRLNQSAVDKEYDDDDDGKGKLEEESPEGGLVEVEDETNQLRNLIVEVAAKLNEVKEQLKKPLTKSVNQQEKSAFGSNSNVQAVNDLSALVRKRPEGSQ